MGGYIFCYIIHLVNMWCYRFSIFLETFPYCLDCDAFGRIERFRGSSRSNCCAIAGWAFGDRELLIAASLPPPRQSTQRAVSSNSSVVTLWSFLSILLSFAFLCHLIWIYCVFNLQWIDWFVCCRLCSWVYYVVQFAKVHRAIDSPDCWPRPPWASTGCSSPTLLKIICGGF